MNTVLMILFFLLAIVMYAGGCLQLREKGVLINNAYLYASKEERQKMNKKPHYRQSGIIFCLIGTIFLINAVQIFTEWEWMFYFLLVVAVFTLVYAVVSSIRIEKNVQKIKS